MLKCNFITSGDENRDFHVAGWEYFEQSKSGRWWLQGGSQIFENASGFSALRQLTVLLLWEV